MSNLSNKKVVDKEERKNRVAYKQQKRALSQETDLISLYKYDGEDGIDEEYLMQIHHVLR